MRPSTGGRQWGAEGLGISGERRGTALPACSFGLATLTRISQSVFIQTNARLRKASTQTNNNEAFEREKR